MENSKKYLKDNSIVPFISFKEIPTHTVELVADKEDSMTDVAGKLKEGISYLVKEDGEAKKFFTSSVSLISKLASCVPGDKVKIMLKSRKTDKGYQSYYEVAKEGDVATVDVDEGIPDYEE